MGVRIDSQKVHPFVPWYATVKLGSLRMLGTGPDFIDEIEAFEMITSWFGS